MNQDLSPSRYNGTNHSTYENQHTSNSTNTDANSPTRRVAVYDRPDEVSTPTTSTLGTILFLIAIAVAIYFYFFSS